jgi:aspartyl-tRNA(Asn)/glutamyl-tRNA(Gln) amidotransferase subunit A
MSVPYGSGDDGMPVGVQVLAPARGETVMFRVGAALEASAPGPARDHASGVRPEALR